MELKFDNIFKILILGDSNVGKSKFLERFCKNTYNEEYKYTVKKN
jgi:GTPase SAR1 family protein